MLTITIDKYKERKEPKRKMKAGSEEHQHEVFTRTLERCKSDDTFEPNVEFGILATGESGYFVNFEEDFYKVEWVGMMCRFIELYVMKRGDFALFHPSELKVL